MHQKRTLLAWSSGKDSAYALWTLQQDPEVEVVGLLTTVNSAAQRVSMHGVRQSVLAAQARMCGLPLWEVPLPAPCSDEEYRAAMEVVLQKARAQGVEAVAFGDLCLEDVRAYREAQMAGTGLEPIFPLWGRPTRAVADEIIKAGLEAVITCVDTERLSRSFLGRAYDASLLAALPADVDPCGENGEFHTAAVAGPMFSAPLPVELGRVEDQGRFVWVDLILGLPLC